MSEAEKKHGLFRKLNIIQAHIYYVSLLSEFWDGKTKSFNKEQHVSAIVNI